MNFVKFFALFMIVMTLKACHCNRIRTRKELEDTGSEYHALDQEQEQEYDAIRRIFQTILNDPEYLSLEPMKRLQILIVFYHILENPNQNWYGSLMEMIKEKSENSNGEHMQDPALAHLA